MRPRRAACGAEDANLAYQNASLTAESLGVSQVYMGFVLTAVRQDGKGGAEPGCWDFETAVSAPSWRSACRQFRYPNYIDRKEPEVRKI